MKVQGIIITVAVVLVLGGALYLLAYYSPLFLRSPQLGFFKWGLYRREVIEPVTEDTITFTDRPQSLRLVFDVEEPGLSVSYDEAVKKDAGQEYLESVVSKYFNMVQLTLFYDGKEHPIDLFNLQSVYRTYIYYGDGIQVRIGSRIWPTVVRYKLVLNEPLEGTTLYVVAGTPAGMSTP